MTNATPFALFDVYGVEIEYMIVDAETLSIRPISDVVLRDENDEPTCDVSDGRIEWSNELVAHVIELKVARPEPELAPLPDLFAASARKIQERLTPHGARLMPGGIHPWMNPKTDTTLWPHEYHEVYASFDRIFDCHRHGWANLQSVHLNLPFSGDAEMAKLHAAIRVLLPLIPALSASTPIKDGEKSPFLDARMDTYRKNSVLVPRITGAVIPEVVSSEAEYRRVILEPIWKDIAPHDPEGTLQHEWLNSRGAIVRFERSAIEIRVIDTQEHPRADISICGGVSEVLKALVDERWSTRTHQDAWSVEALVEILDATITHGEHAVITNQSYLDLFGFPGRAPAKASDVWRHVLEAVGVLEASSPFAASLNTILDHGTLASRMLSALPKTPAKEDLRVVCTGLADSLQRDEPFLP